MNHAAALHTTAAKSLAYQVEEAADLGASFADLIAARDEASDLSDWIGAAEIDAELSVRREDAASALRKEFREAADMSTSIPMVVAGKLGAMPIAEYLTEIMGTNEGTGYAVRMALSPFGRASVIAELASAYAAEFGEELLMCGWSAQ